MTCKPCHFQHIWVKEDTSEEAFKFATEEHAKMYRHTGN